MAKSDRAGQADARRPRSRRENSEGLSRAKPGFLSLSGDRYRCKRQSNPQLLNLLELFDHLLTTAVVGIKLHRLSVGLQSILPVMGVSIAFTQTVPGIP